MDRIDSNINWDDVIKKEARGLRDAELGEDQELHNENVLTQKGVVSKDRYYLPKRLLSRFDGKKIWFNITNINDLNTQIIPNNSTRLDNDITTIDTTLTRTTLNYTLFTYTTLFRSK